MMENGIVKRVRCDCSRCTEYLKTNPLCKLGRNTSNNKLCKWFYSIKKKGTKITVVKTANKIKSTEYCIGCAKNEKGFCLIYKRFASFARSACLEMKGKV